MKNSTLELLYLDQLSLSSRTKSLPPFSMANKKSNKVAVSIIGALTAIAATVTALKEPLQGLLGGENEQESASSSNGGINIQLNQEQSNKMKQETKIDNDDF